MIYTLVSIKDHAIEAFQGVQAVRHPSEATRGFTDAINNPESGNMYKHPDDFDLYLVGTFNDSTGEIIANVELLTRGDEAKIEEQPRSNNGR